MTWFAIYEIPKDNLPVLRGKFDTKEEAMRWAKTQEPGDYALFSMYDDGWTFLPIRMAADRPKTEKEGVSE